MEKAEIRAMIKNLENNRQNLSSYQADFIKGLKRYLSKYNKLSDRQTEALLRINQSVFVEK